jgi:cyclohexyl-isocyanide hydratase
MRIAFILFNDMTALDFVGIYDPLTRLKSMGFMSDVTWDICAREAEVRDDKGMKFVPTQVNTSLGKYDLIVVPGGFGTRELCRNLEFIAWLQTAATCKLKVSVCTGALLLGAAGFLKGRKATTHPNALEELREYCQSVVHERVVDTGDVITGGGVTSAIDVGLHVVDRLAGREAGERIRRQMDYPYNPQR